jgi:hypothetical protein
MDCGAKKKFQIPEAVTQDKVHVGRYSTSTACISGSKAKTHSQQPQQQQQLQ